MSTLTSHTSSTYSRYIGRVGALAAALGIGMAVITSPGLALADGTESSASTADNTDTTKTDTTGTDTTSTATGSTAPSSTVSGSTSTEGTTTQTTTASTSSTGSTSSSTEVAPGVTVSSSGGAQSGSTATAPTTAETTPTSTAATQTDQPTPTASATTAAASAPSAATSAASSSNSMTSSNVGTTAPTATTAVTSLALTNVASTLTTPATATVADSNLAAARSFAADVSNALTTAVDTTAVVPPAQATNPVVGVVNFFNAVVTTLLNPFLAPAPNTPEPFTPVAWAVLAWVRRNLFNEAPTINVAPTTLTLGPTATGVLATDPEGDPLTYTVTGATQTGPSTWATDTGIVTIDQASNIFTFTPNDINYAAEQSHSFTVSVTDGKTNLLSLFGAPHSDQETVTVTVQPPITQLVTESRAGLVSGIAIVTETQQPWCPTTSCQSPSDPVLTIRTVEYTNFADQAGFVLNGTETTATNPNRTFIHYLADIEMTDEHGADRGFLQGNARVVTTTNQQTGQTTTTRTGYIVSSVDGNLQGVMQDPVAANVTVNFGDELGALLHTERYNNFHVSTTFADQRPEDVEFLNEVGLHGEIYRAWLNSPNQTEPTCIGSKSTCELSPSMKAYLQALGAVSDAQIANLRLQEAGVNLTQAEMTGMLLAVKREQPKIMLIEGWNEPDAPGGIDGGIPLATVYSQYQALYRAVNDVNATLAAEDPNYVPLKVGGPAMYYFNKDLLSDFLTRYAADTDPNKRLDFISYHAYVNILPVPPGSPPGTRPVQQFYKENPSWVMNYRNELDAMLAARGLPTNMPVYVTETGIYPGPLCDMCDSTDYARQAAGMLSLQYWLSQQHDTYVFNWVARRQGLKDQFVTQNAVGPHLDTSNPRNPTVLWQPLATLPSDTLTPYGNVMLMQSMMEDVKVAATSDQLANGVGVYTVAAKDPVLPEASVMVWNYPGCSGTPGTTSCGSTVYDAAINMSQLPNGLGDGPVTVTVYRVDQHTSNYWADPLNTDLSEAQLEQVDQRTVQPVNGGISYQADLLPNTVYLILLRKAPGVDGI
jgi:hypothetical protein